MAEWKKVIVSGSNAELATLNATSVTASLSGNVVGDLTGTASWATTASWALNSPASISSSYAVSASYALSASQAANSNLLEGSNKAFYTDASNINAGTIGNAFLPSAINVTSVTASLLGNVIGNLTGNADTATSASHAVNADLALDANTATSASHAVNADLAANSNLLEGSNKAFYRDATNINAGTIGNAFLPSAINVSTVTASLSGNVVGDLTGTASWATNAVNSSGSVSSSYAEFASIAGALATNNTFSITGGGISATGITFNGTSSVALNASIDADAVTTAKIADDAVTTAKIAASAVGATELAADAVTNVKLADNAVETINIVAANVTNDKLANSSLTVGSTSIALGASATTLAGLTSVTSTGFTGALTGNADTATTTTGTSTGQGKVTVGTNVDIDLGLQTTASPTFANLAIAGSGSYSGALVVQGDLTVNGTASFINTQDLLIEDKFVTFASGSTTATDGGFIVSQASGNVGQAFAFQSAGARWGVESGVAYNATSITPDAYVSLVAVTQSDTDYQKLGNIFVSGSGDIFMWG